MKYKEKLKRNVTKAKFAEPKYVEWLLIVMIIAIAVVVIVALLGDAIREVQSNIVTGFQHP